MKKLVVLALFIAPFVGFAQKKTDSKVFNGATKLILTNTNSAEDNYKLAAKTLLDADYAIEKSDKEFFQLYTEPVTAIGEGTTRALTIYVVSKDHQIIIVGKTKKRSGLQLVNTNPDTENFEIMPYKNSKLMKDIFKRLEDFAILLKSGKVTFSE